MIKTEILPYNGYDLYLAKADSFTTKLRLQNNNWLFKRWYNLFDQIIDDKPRLVIDIGANYGVATIEFYARNFSDNFVLFEPIAENCYCIDETFKNAQFKYRLINSGLSNKTGTASFHYKKTMSGVSGISDDTTGNREIPITTLDSYDFQDVKFIKIDTEGHELEVLEGCKQTIKNSQPILFFEVDPKNTNQRDKITDIFRLLDSWDYICVNSSFHKITNLDDVDICNQVSNALADNVRDLVAVPKSHPIVATLKSIDINKCINFMTEKMGHKLVKFHNVNFVECKSKDSIYTADLSKVLYVNDNFFKTDKKSQKIYVKQNDKFYWSYELFLKYNKVDHFERLFTFE